MHDIVVPYRNSYSTEMRYMLRSLSNLPHRRVFVIGDSTPYRVNHIPFTQGADMAKNTLEIINIAARNPSISSDFIYMHDDMFVLNKIDRLPVRHRGLYSEIIDEYLIKDVKSIYVNRMVRTQNQLKSMGIKNPLCYELHIPFTINKSLWIKTSPYITSDFNKLSMYGNLNHIGGTKMQDVKVRRGEWFPVGDFLSTHDASFHTNEAGKYIRNLFSERSPYEYL